MPTFHRNDRGRRHFLKLLAAGLPPALAMQATTGGDAIRVSTARAITRGPKFHWRGYYDKLLFDPTNRFVLANEVDFEGRSPTPADTIRVGMIDTQARDSWTDLGGTHAWNWQQGCMLQWVPGTESEIAWNDREDGAFVTRLLDVSTGRTRTLPHPFYCLSADGRTAFAPDFRRLNDMRPGYGYGGIPDPNRDHLAPDDAGIWRMDMQTGEHKLIFSFADAVRIPFAGKPEAAFTATSKHWFNHLLCNPDGTRLFFLHRWREPQQRPWYTRAFTIDFDGSNPFVLDSSGSTSHFVWRDSTHVSAFSWHASHKARFYVFEDKTRNVEAIGPDTMTQDGHLTYVPGTGNEWILNDTYPDANELQHPYLFHIPTGRRVSLGDYRSPAAYRKEWRCDTHPCASRDGKKVVFDSPHDGGRQVYLVEIADIVSRS